MKTYVVFFQLREDNQGDPCRAVIVKADKPYSIDVVNLSDDSACKQAISEISRYPSAVEQGFVITQVTEINND
jgi:hypothetical protein